MYLPDNLISDDLDLEAPPVHHSWWDTLMVHIGLYGEYHMLAVFLFILVISFGLPIGLIYFSRDYYTRYVARLIPFMTLILLVFIKIGGFWGGAHWSWWIVLTPLWVPVAFFSLILIIKQLEKGNVLD